MLKRYSITVYGETTYRATTKLQTLNRQAASAKCKWIFLCRCLEHEVLPKSFITRPVIRTQRAYRETREHNMRMLEITRNHERTQYHRYLQNITEIVDRLRNELSTTDLQNICRITEKSRENKYQKEKQRLKEKFDKLVRENETNEEMQNTKIKHEIVDLTKNGVDEDVKAYLKLGPDFSETPRKIPYEKVIIETEYMCKMIEREIEDTNEPLEKYRLEKEVHTLREKVKKALIRQKDKKIKSNLTKQQQLGRKKMYEDEKHVYLPADKGKVMVAMDKTVEEGGENSYEHKMKKVMQDLKAKPSTRRKEGQIEDWDVTEKVSKEGRAIISEIVEKGEITEQKGRWMKPNDCRAPRITGYPKIHKENVPLRGVVSFIGSPYENVAKTLVPILRSLQGRSGHYIKNS